MMRSACAGILIVLSVAGIAAQTPTPAPGAGPKAVLPPRVGVSGEPLALTLEEAIRMAIEHNNDVSIARLETGAARQSIRAAEGIFDPRLLPSVLYQRVVSPSTSTISGGTNGKLENKTLSGLVEVTGRAPWAGGRFTVDFSSARNENSNLLSRLNPQFPSALGASYVQPLLRGRTIDAERRQILLAKRAADLTDAQLTQVMMDQLTLVEEAYWNLAFAVRSLEVQTQALGQAEGQVSSNERQSQQGTLAPIDVVEAQTQVANFRQSVASAQQALTIAENRLKRLMLANRDADIWNHPLVPGGLADREPPAVSLPEAMRLALARRPELAALETSRAQNAIDRDYYRDLARPQFNVVGAFTLSGLAGRALTTTTDPLSNTTNAAFFTRLNDLSSRLGLSPLDAPTSTTSTVPEFLTGNLSDSYTNLFSRRFPTALVQVQMELPFVNNTAKANIARADIAATQISRQRQQLEQEIEVEVRGALQAVHSSEARHQAAGSAHRNAREQYESERRRFESGIGTVFLVLQRQTSLVTAQAQELRARADLNQAIALFDRAIGGTLERHGIKLQ